MLIIEEIMVVKIEPLCYQYSKQTLLNYIYWGFLQFVKFLQVRILLRWGHEQKSHKEKGQQTIIEMSEQIYNLEQK